MISTVIVTAYSRLFEAWLRPKSGKWGRGAVNIVFAILLILVGIVFLANALNSLSGGYGTIRRWKNMALALAVSGAAFWGAFSLLT